MRNFTKVFFVAVMGVGAAVAAACADDGNNIVRERPDGGDASFDAASDGPAPNTLACGVPIPATYESPNFAVNAKEELDLKTRVEDLLGTMERAEGPTPAAVTAADLTAIFTAGTPSLRSIATAYAQATIDTYIQQFGEGVGKTWKPEDVEADAGAEAGADGGVLTGGKYDNASIVNPIGIDIRETTEKVLFDGSLYNYALQLASGVVTEATVDQLTAIFGATPKFANDAVDGGPDTDTLIAEYAAKRDNKTGTLGPYRKIKRALLVAKTAAAAGGACKADLDGALKIFFLEWEKTAYATVIFYLNQAAQNAVAIPQKGQLALHSYGEALGFIESFKGIPQDRRVITDVQIDGLLTRVSAAKPYRLVTQSGDVVGAFSTAFQEIGGIYGFTQTEIEDFKKVY
ncbi:MAG: hypothetical protein QOI41_1943 [Myxococcales bacterium]|nr:hypothetical protein [Myxococcales bacterium]